MYKVFSMKLVTMSLYSHNELLIILLFFSRFSPADTNLVLREFEKCGVILKHVPGPRDANWMHILFQVLNLSYDFKFDFCFFFQRSINVMMLPPNCLLILILYLHEHVSKKRINL